MTQNDNCPQANCLSNNLTLIKMIYKNGKHVGNSYKCNNCGHTFLVMFDDD